MGLHQLPCATNVLLSRLRSAPRETERSPSSVDQAPGQEAGEAHLRSPGALGEGAPTPGQEGHSGQGWVMLGFPSPTGR